MLQLKQDRRRYFSCDICYEKIFYFLLIKFTIHSLSGEAIAYFKFLGFNFLFICPPMMRHQSLLASLNSNQGCQDTFNSFTGVIMYSICLQCYEELLS